MAAAAPAGAAAAPALEWSIQTSRPANPNTGLLHLHFPYNDYMIDALKSASYEETRACAGGCVLFLVLCVCVWCVLLLLAARASGVYSGPLSWLSPPSPTLFETTEKNSNRALLERPPQVLDHP